MDNASKIGAKMMEFSADKALPTAPTSIVTDLSNLGLNDVAYIKPAIIDGHRLWAVHAADGTPLTTLATRDTAFVAVRQHELDPVSVH